MNETRSQAILSATPLPRLPSITGIKRALASGGRVSLCAVVSVVSYQGIFEGSTVSGGHRVL